MRVNIFGSARLLETSPYYAQAETLGRLLSQAGLSVITGGGPGIMEAANKGAFQNGSLSIGLNITCLTNKNRINIKILT
jgi:predicted Rossmann-fold nucleotide-binding protein